ncbi:MAG: T9SS type A sorting domain-containing protein [Bacteroidetes bacterium]|nr:T9SS type A sorting domain-containing protein [Bacteroidota bacterium]
MDHYTRHIYFDGCYYSKFKNPQVKFNSAGAYTIRLFATSYGNGYDTTIKTNYINVKNSSNVTISSLNKNNICAGDSALITVNGAINYSWSPAGTCTAPTSATTYLKPTVNTTYIVTGSAAGGGCIDTESVFITVKPSPTVNVTGSNTICIGQATTLNATTTSGTINWSPSTGLNTTTGTSVIATPTVSTTYNASAVGTNACVGYFNFPVTVNPRPKIIVSGNNIICTGGSTNLTASGANNLFWTPGLGLNIQTGPNVIASPTNNATYTIIGNNAQNCFDTAKYSVSVVSGANVTILPSATTICLGDTATLNVKGCITYTISPNANTSFKNDSTIYVFQNTTGTTTYTIEGSISPTCKNTKTQALTVNPKPTVGLTATKSTINKGESTNLNASGAITYTWSPSSTLSSSTGAAVTATPTDTTTYTVVGLNQFNCSNKATIKIIVLKNSSIQDLSEKVKIYPNPTSALLNIEMTEKSKIAIYDVQGKMVYTESLPIGTTKIDLSKLSKGEYLVKFGSNQEGNYKFILE